MQAIRKIVSPVGRLVSVELPEDWPESASAEVIVFPVESSSPPEHKLSFSEWMDLTWGSIPDFPDRFPQGEYEIRKSLDD